MIKYLLVIILLTIACTRKEKPAFFLAPENNSKNIAFTNLMSDTLTIDSLRCSYVGNLYICGEKILFIDKINCFCYQFDKDGVFESKHLGKGRSKKEIAADEITGYTPCTNGDHVFFSDLTYFIYDSLFNIKTTNTVKTNALGVPKNKLHGSNPLVYSWPYDKFIIRRIQEKIFYTAIYKGTSSLLDPNNFFNEARTILQIDLTNGTPESVIGRYSPIYQREHIHQFNYCSFDIDKDGSFYICFEADSLIYKYNKDFIPTKTFGFSGNSMDCNYTKMYSQANIRDIYIKERQTRGFYDQLEYIDKLNWLFRIYRKGEKNQTDGLQIYNQTQTLIADINIPKKFQIAGYITPYLYLYLVNEDDEKINIIKLAIDKQ